MQRIMLLVLDSVGVGALPDAGEYGDAGSNTLAHVAEAVGGLKLPHMAALGLGNILEVAGVPAMTCPTGSFGKMAERSKGKDTTTGHWEMAGLILEKPFPTYPQGFPPEIIKKFEAAIGRGVLGNKPASGTEIIEELGPEHLRTGFPIVYTSADSVMQIAAHQEIVPLSELYRYCTLAREMLTGEHAVGRVIARPFVGNPGSFYRTPYRHDYSLVPPTPNMLDNLVEAGKEVVAVGKIQDIFAGRGISRHLATVDNQDGVDRSLQAWRELDHGLVFTNLVEYDQKYGHRNDAAGYARALEEFDRRVPELLKALGEEDALVLTADHGCDPTTPGTDHTREYVPVLLFGPVLVPGVNLGVRSSLADLGATVLDLLGAPAVGTGVSFASLVQ